MSLFKSKSALTKCILGIIIAFIACALSFSLLKVLVYCISPAVLQQNLGESADIMLHEGGNYRDVVADANMSTRIDNFCTSILLGVSGHGQGVVDAFSGYYYQLDETQDTLGKNQVLGLQMSVGHDVGDELNDNGYWRPYSRYWHGYAVIIRPLLLLFNLNQIRMLLVMASSVLLLVVASLLARIKKWAGVAFALPFFAVNYLIVMVSVSYAATFFLALIFSLVIIRKVAPSGKADSNQLFDWPFWTISFFVAGALTSYFDFLGTPIVTLGVPLALLLYLCNDKISPRSIGRCIGFIAACCACWALGYGLLWATEWLIASVITGTNVLANGLSQVGTYTVEDIDSGSGSSITPISALRQNISLLFPAWARLCLAACLIVLVIIGFVKRRNLKHVNWTAITLLIAVGMLSYAWFIAVPNHSHIHCFFAFRTQLVFVTSFVLCAELYLSSLFGNERKPKHNGKKQ